MAPSFIESWKKSECQAMWCAAGVGGNYLKAVAADGGQGFLFCCMSNSSDDGNDTVCCYVVAKGLFD